MTALFADGGVGSGNEDKVVFPHGAEVRWGKNLNCINFKHFLSVFEIVFVVSAAVLVVDMLCHCWCDGNVGGVSCVAVVGLYIFDSP